MTVSLCVILMEMVGSDSSDLLPFLMVTIVVAKGAADRLGDSYLLRRTRMKRLPFIQRMPHLSQRRRRFTAASVVRLRDHPLLPEYALPAPHPLCPLPSCCSFLGV